MQWFKLYVGRRYLRQCRDTTQFVQFALNVMVYETDTSLVKLEKIDKHKIVIYMYIIVMKSL